MNFTELMDVRKYMEMIGIGNVHDVILYVSWYSRTLVGDCIC